MWFETKLVVLTSGYSVGGSPLNAFDNALRQAGIADFNLIRVSSIVPPRVPVRHLKPGVRPVSGEGLMVPAIYETQTSKSIGLVMASAVGVGVARDRDRAGVVFVSSCEGPEDEAVASVREMVEEGMRAKGIIEYDCEVASAATTVTEAWTAVLAAAFFCDADIAGVFPSFDATDRGAAHAV